MPRNSKMGGLGKGLNALIKTPTTVEEANEIDIFSIEPNPNQPRQYFAEDALTTLEDSIRQFGLVQPVVVRKVEGKYQLVAGERRWRACKNIGMKTIPAIIKNYSTEETTEIALVENLQRQDLDPIEEAYAYKRLMDVFKLTQDSVASKVGRSRSHVANMLRLLHLPNFVQDELSAGEVTIGQVRPLLSLKTVKQQREALQIIKTKELSARQVEALVKQMLSEKKRPKGLGLSQTAEFRKIIEDLKLSLGTAVDIKLKPGNKVKGKIEISFSSEEELERLITYFQEEEETSSDKGVMIEKFRV